MKHLSSGTRWITSANTSMRSSLMMMRVRIERWRFFADTQKSLWLWQIGRGKRTSRHAGLPRVDIADFYCRRRANICSSIGCFASTRMSAFDLRGYMERTHSSDSDGVRVQLFDAYMTPGDQAPYQGRLRTIELSSFLRPGT